LFYKIISKHALGVYTVGINKSYSISMTDSNPVTPAGKNTTMAIIAYIIFFVPLLTGDAKKDSFVNYHTKQGLVLFLAAVAVNIVGSILPFIWIAIGWLVSLAILALMIIGIINAVNGKQQPLPVIGNFSKLFKF
jgi:uncharacterized membrane protein